MLGSGLVAGSVNGASWVSVRDTTYLGMSFIRSANGSPARPGQAAAIVCQVRRPTAASPLSP